MRKNENKLKNLIVYILSEYNNSNLTKTKLQKLLYFCDFEYYETEGKSITGFKYRKNHYGPTIAELDEYLKELEKDGYIEIIEGNNFFGSPQTTFGIKKRISDYSKIFSDSELKVINEVNNAYAALKPNEISRLSHGDFPYKATNYLDIIEYSLVRYRNHGEDILDREDYRKFSSKEFSEVINKFAKKFLSSENK